MAAAPGLLEAHARHIAAFQAQPQPQPLPDTAVTQAFGAWAFPKIVAGLRSDDADVRRKSVVAARELLVAPEQHAQCLAAGITPALVSLLKPAAAADATGPAPQEQLQASAAATMALLLSKAAGCADGLRHGALPALLQLLKQASAAVRDAAYGALGAAALFEPWRAALVREGALPALLLYAQTEDLARAAAALELLHHCTQARHNQEALSQLIAVQQAVPKLAALISARGPEPVVHGAVKLLAALASTQPEGRTQAVERGCVAELLALVGAAGGKQDLACAAASALMMLTLAKEGKVAFYKAGGLGVMRAALDAQLAAAARGAGGGGPDLHEALAVACCQCLANAAEYGPCGGELQRSRELRGALAQLQGSAAEGEGEGVQGGLVSSAAGAALRTASAWGTN